VGHAARLAQPQLDAQAHRRDPYKEMTVRSLNITLNLHELLAG
jgi:hypothetical protein